MPVPGHVAGLVASGGGEVDVAEVVPGGEGVSWVSGSGLGTKEFD